MSTVATKLDLQRPERMPDPPMRGDAITGERYTSTEWFQKEWDRMWMKTWQIGCLSYDIPEPGDYASCELGKESFLLIRQDNGGVRAFYNVCQHRGARLTFADVGVATNGISCPYHGWVWGQDGLLDTLPDEEDYPGESPCGKMSLTEVNCEEFLGMVWFNMDPNCIPLQESLGSAGQMLATYRMENMVRVLNDTAEANCNWKIITDNFNEGYHIQVLHPELAPYIEAYHEECQFDLRENGSNSGWFPAHRPTSTYGGDVLPEDVAMMARAWDIDPDAYHGNEKLQQVRIDIQKKKRELGPARGYKHYEHLADYQLTDYVIYNVFPNNVMSAGPDGVQLLRPRPHPTDPNKCLFDHWYFVPRIEGVDTVPSPAGGPDLKIEDAEHNQFRYGDESLGRTNDQDLSIAENQQQGLASAGFRGANLMKQECRLQHFHETLNDYVEGRQ